MIAPSWVIPIDFEPFPSISEPSGRWKIRLDDGSSIQTMIMVDDHHDQHHDQHQFHDEHLHDHQAIPLDLRIVRCCGLPDETTARLSLQLCHHTPPLRWGRTRVGLAIALRSGTAFGLGPRTSSLHVCACITHVCIGIYVHINIQKGPEPHIMLGSSPTQRLRNYPRTSGLFWRRTICIYFYTCIHVYVFTIMPSCIYTSILLYIITSLYNT